MIYRDRRSAKAERLREWADKVQWNELAAFEAVCAVWNLVWYLIPGHPISLLFDGRR